MAFADPDIAAFRAQLAAAPRGGVDMATLDVRRKAFDDQHGAVPCAEGCTLSAITHDSVVGERITPGGAAAKKAFVYHHGGGYMFGSVLSHRHLVSRLARAAGVAAFNMDYRLAPEHPYPAALDDAVRNYKFVLAQGYEPADIVIGGESAGGNLTAALLLRLAKEGLPLPAGAYLLSPWLDMTAEGESYALRDDPMLSHEAMLGAARAYTGGADPRDPLISPAKGAWRGLPPLLIQVGSDEVLLSDSLELARRAALEGVGVDLQVRPEMVHAWPLFHFALPTAGNAAIAAAGAWIAQKLRLRPVVV